MLLQAMPSFIYRAWQSYQYFGNPPARLVTAPAPPEPLLPTTGCPKALAGTPLPSSSGPHLCITMFILVQRCPRTSLGHTRSRRAAVCYSPPVDMHQQQGQLFEVLRVARLCCSVDRHALLQGISRPLDPDAVLLQMGDEAHM